MPMSSADRVRPVASLQEFFRDSVSQAMQRQGVRAEDHTAHYVVNLLTLFARSEALYEKTQAGIGLKPLALMLAEAAEAPGGEHLVGGPGQLRRRAGQEPAVRRCAAGDTARGGGAGPGGGGARAPGGLGRSRRTPGSRRRGNPARSRGCGARPARWRRGAPTPPASGGPGRREIAQSRKRLTRSA